MKQWKTTLVLYFTWQKQTCSDILGESMPIDSFRREKIHSHRNGGSRHPLRHRYDGGCDAVEMTVEGYEVLRRVTKFLQRDLRQRCPKCHNAGWINERFTMRSKGLACKI